MKRKIFAVICIILIIIMLKLACNIVVNNLLIKTYEEGKYLEGQAKLLTYVNFIQRYIANYNYGNMLYQNGKYDEAIEEYKKALEANVPEEECSIRINYALAICKTVTVDETDQTSIKNAIEKYESAINVLTENGCANKNDNNGHSQKAERLKKDIQKEIDRLKKLQKDDTQTNDKDGKKEEDEKKEKDIEDKIQEIKENATKEQRNTESEYKNYGNFDFQRVDKNW